MSADLTRAQHSLREALDKERKSEDIRATIADGDKHEEWNRKLNEENELLYRHLEAEKHLNRVLTTYLVGADKIRDKWDTVLAVLDMALKQDDLHHVKIMICELIHAIEENDEH